MGDTSSESHLVRFLAAHSDFILNVVAPLVWIGLFVNHINVSTVYEFWYMPLLGFGAALLANSIPIGGGVVYIPALSLLGSQISLGASFTIATMPIGNGIFGLLRWLQKDPSSIVWESFPYTVLPSWIGTFAALSMLPTPPVAFVKIGFGVFCAALGFLVVLALYRGGLRNVFMPPSQDLSLVRRVQEPSKLIADYDVTEDDRAHELAELTGVSSQVSNRDWGMVVAASLVGGAVLVPNIGIGPALVTYVLLSLLGYSEHQARVTGIITGGWVCIAPFFLNIFVFNDVPSQLWLMVLPGVFLGAKYAPALVERIGTDRLMVTFATFLFASALLFFFH